MRGVKGLKIPRVDFFDALVIHVVFLQCSGNVVFDKDITFRC